MTTTGAEERKRIREKRLQKRKRNRKLIGISLCILFIVVACITIISCFGDDTYRSEKEFKEYAELISEDKLLEVVRADSQEVVDAWRLTMGQTIDKLSQL